MDTSPRSGPDLAPEAREGAPVSAAETPAAGTPVTDAPAAEAPAPHGWRIAPTTLAWIIVSLAALFYTYEFALRIVPSVMEEELMANFKILAGGFGLLSAAYYFVYTPMQLPVGMLMDIFGPRRLLTSATLVCAVGIFLFAATDVLGIAVVGRCLMGLGSAFAFIGAMKLAAIWFPPHRFALFSGLISSLGMVGAMVGDNTLAVMVTDLGWRETCYTLGILGVVLGVAIGLVVHDRPPEGYHVPQHHSVDTSVRVLWISFWKVASRAQTWKTGLAGSIMFLPISVIGSLWGPPLMESIDPGMPLVEATAVTTMVFLGYALGSPAIGHLSDHFRNRKLPMVIGSIGATASFATLVLMPGLPVWLMYVLSFLTGLFGSAQALVFVAGREANRADAAGTTIAMVNMLVTFGGMLFQPIVGYLLQWQQATYGGAVTQGAEVFYTAEQFRWAILPIIVLMVLNILLVFWIKETRARQHYLHPHSHPRHADDEEEERVA
ncbi:MAG: MFS transporter [Verrucomicrobiota bacterium]